MLRRIVAAVGVGAAPSRRDGGDALVNERDANPLRLRAGSPLQQFSKVVNIPCARIANYAVTKSALAPGFHVEREFLYHGILFIPFASHRLLEEDENRNILIPQLRENGSVTITMQFRDWGGMFMEHCHNTMHEDNAMLLRWEINAAGGVFLNPLPTPIPKPTGVTFQAPDEILTNAF